MPAITLVQTSRTKFISEMLFQVTNITDGRRRIVKYTSDATLKLSDAGCIIECESATPMTLTVPSYANVPFNSAIPFQIVQTGVGSVTISGQAGVSIEATSLTLNLKDSSGYLYRRDAVDDYVFTMPYDNNLRTDIAASTGASLLGSVQSVLNAVATTQSEINSRVLAPEDFGIRKGSSFAVSNCDALAKLAAYVNSVKGNITIKWSSGQYQFSPKDNSNYTGSNYAWRNAIEFIDCVNVYHKLDGTEIYVRADPTWTRGNSTPVSGLDEGIFQFRATGTGTSHHVGVIGTGWVHTDATVKASSAASDGAAFGIVYRGCQSTTTKDVYLQYWGTDGLYIGASYGGAPVGDYHYLDNVSADSCYRQGISIAGASNGLIVGGTISNTNGSSFGHGIDFEPNGSTTQSNWTVVSLNTFNNQLGACNFINTSNVAFINPNFNEQATTTNGAVYIDGSNVAGYNVKDITFINGSIQSLQPVLFVSGSSATGQGGIDNITFRGTRLKCLGATPNYNAAIAINPGGTTGRQIGTFNFIDCAVDGNGGFTIKSDGTHQATLNITGGTWNLANYAGGNAVVFTVNVGSALDVVNLRNWTMTIASGATMTTTSPYIITGSMSNCTLSGQSGAQVAWVDYGAGRTNFIIGYNYWSTYNFYQGCNSALTVKYPAAIQTPLSGDYGLQGRFVHGGRQRIIAYLASPSSFTNQQAPRDGDICPNIANSGASVCETEYYYDGSISAWTVTKSRIKSGTTANRPSPVTALQAVCKGIQYLDTTLAANGKLVIWNGSAWVDTTGTIV